MATRKNMVIVVASKSNKNTGSIHWHIVEYSSTLLLKKSIVELYAQNKPIIKLMLNEKEARDLATPRLKLQVTPP